MPRPLTDEQLDALISVGADRPGFTGGPATVPRLLTTVLRERALRKRAETALDRYARHENACGFWVHVGPGANRACTCGLAAALAPENLK